MIVLLLGSNLGNRKEYLDKAAGFIEEQIGDIILRSSVYETQTWGFSDSGLFLNQLVCLEHSPEPGALLNKLLQIETKMGRKRKEQKYSSRLIDIDILFYNSLIVKSKDLEIPHPRLHLRKFALIPLNELFHCFIHPVLGKTVEELLDICNDPLEVRKYLF